MSFLDHYLKKERLAEIDDKVKKNLDKIENKITRLIDSNPTASTFDECIKRLGPQIADLVDRFHVHFKESSGIGGSLKFVFSIGVEVFQIVEDVKDCVVTGDMTEQQAHAAKVEFGQELIFFVWMTVNPFGSRFNWIPFKKTIEKKLIYWIAGMALNATVDMFAANAEVETFGVELIQRKKKVKRVKRLIKAIP